VFRAAVRKIVTIDAGDHYVPQSHLRGHSGNIGRLIRIERTGMPALGHRAESASARAQVSQDHERRRAAVKTFMHVGAARRFAYRVQIQPAKLGFELMHGVKVGPRLAQPLRQAWSSGRELNQRVHNTAKPALEGFYQRFFARKTRILEIGPGLGDIGNRAY